MSALTTRRGSRRAATLILLHRPEGQVLVRGLAQWWVRAERVCETAPSEVIVPGRYTTALFTHLLAESGLHPLRTRLDRRVAAALFVSFRMWTGCFEARVLAATIQRDRLDVPTAQERACAAIDTHLRLALSDRLFGRAA